MEEKFLNLTLKVWRQKRVRRKVKLKPIRQSIFLLTPLFWKCLISLMMISQLPV